MYYIFIYIFALFFYTCIKTVVAIAVLVINYLCFMLIPSYFNYILLSLLCKQCEIIAISANWCSVGCNNALFNCVPNQHVRVRGL